MGRTTIELDDRLVEAAMEVTGARTKSEAIEIRFTSVGRAGQSLPVDSRPSR
jgi:Arc/MetJ family transcription regulator